MAAGGWKIFTAGDVLTADDTMDYLQQGVLVFDSSGARGSAIASPAEGQFSYLKDTDATEYYDGASWTPVAQGGLVHIVTESFSAVSSVSLDNCFSGDYDNYRVLVDGSNSTSNYFEMRLRSAGTDLSTSTYNYQFFFSGSTSLSGNRTTGATSWTIGYAATQRFVTDLLICSPYAATTTAGSSLTNNVSPEIYQYALYNSTGSGYDGFTLYPASGTITGTVSVYGYKS